MPTTIAQRADEMIQAIESEAFARQRRVSGSDLDTALWQIEHLESLVRRLCQSVDLQAESIANQAEEVKRLTAASIENAATIRRQRNQIHEQAGQLNDLRFRLCDDDCEDLSDERRREAASFAHSTGAAAALRGEPS